MTALSRFTKPSNRWANELWNVSLLPIAGAGAAQAQNEAHASAETPASLPELRKLENLDQRRSESAVARPLRVSSARSGGNLV